MTFSHAEAAEIGSRLRSRMRWAGIAMLSLSQLVLSVDTSVVNVALPRIQSALGFSSAGLSWVVTAYALAFGGLVLLSGRIGAIIGPRRALLLGTAIFVIGSALGGLASSPGILVTARAIQGVGAALAAPSTLVLIMGITEPGTQRARAMSFFVAALGSGAAIGLVLGGVLTTTLGWRWVMFVNVPLGLFVLAGVRWTVPRLPRATARLDLMGAVSSTVAMAALVYGLTLAASDGWSSTRTLSSFTVAIVALGILIAAERRHPSPVLPLGFFSRMRSAAPFLAMLLIPAGQFGFLYFAALFTQDALGYSPLLTGLVVLPFTAALVLVNVVVPRLVARFGERVTGGAGMAALTLGLLWMSLLDASSTFLSGLLGPFLVLGVGAGLTVAPLTSVLLAQGPEERLSAASSLNQGLQQLGGAVGLASLTTVFTAAGGGVDGITTALLAGTAFPALAFLLFTTGARRIGDTR
ncbi:drug resistance transporter, EmrB/QacA subfamily [Amycolatopsis pretoriensis]|uniref:Drug resistance transporter, EmrB/QacA subfamily n=1 Tax=Amycolatopsis pretoriensis TaxID=218821 RepID=A0A1H5RI81_9PSEU|nr:MFS transporter [Amycolatopsis pretoriensis]SEF38056.1 drug resistance transporter, EmrB/QacA subfamily [Amycolatopsis pretoriensis]